MAASDNLHDVQFDVEHYPPSETGVSFAQHRVYARVGGEEVGRMSWSHKGISWIGVHPDYQRQGIATGMWEKGHQVAAERHDVARPQHNSDRTDEGTAWAIAVGGRLPRQTL